MLIKFEGRTETIIIILLTVVVMLKKTVAQSSLSGLEKEKIMDKLICSIIVLFVVLLMCSLRIQLDDRLVSGIVYDASFNSSPGNQTCFSVRASENMAVTERTSPVYCVNGESPYTAIVEKAARDKSVKVVVKVSKIFKLVDPFRAADNITVEELKK